MRLLWVGMAEDDAAAMNRWYISDFAADCSDAALFLMSRTYDAVLFGAALPAREVALRVADLKARRPRTLAVALEKSAAGWGEREFLGWGGELFIPAFQYRDAELLRLRIERFLLRGFSGESVQIGLLRVEPGQSRVFVGCEEIRLPKRAFTLLYHLLLKRHRFLGKEELLCALYEQPEYVAESSVDYAVCVIRERIDRRFETPFVATVRNRGYRFVYNA